MILIKRTLPTVRWRDVARLSHITRCNGVSSCVALSTGCVTHSCKYVIQDLLLRANAAGRCGERMSWPAVCRRVPTHQADTRATCDAASNIDVLSTPKEDWPHWDHHGQENQSPRVLSIDLADVPSHHPEMTTILSYQHDRP